MMAGEAERYIVLHRRDNVAVALAPLSRGEAVPVPGRDAALTLATDVPYLHKFALSRLHAGDAIVKYGVPIGTAYREIGPGEHVHLHNLRTRMADTPAGDGPWANREGDPG